MIGAFGSHQFSRGVRDATLVGELSWNGFVELYFDSHEDLDATLQDDDEMMKKAQIVAEARKARDAGATRYSPNISRTSVDRLAPTEDRHNGEWTPIYRSGTVALIAKRIDRGEPLQASIATNTVLPERGACFSRDTGCVGRGDLVSAARSGRMRKLRRLWWDSQITKSKPIVIASNEALVTSQLAFLD